MSAARFNKASGRQKARFSGSSASISRACDRFMESRGERNWSFGEMMKFEVMKAKGHQNRRDKADEIARELEQGWEG